MSDSKYTDFILGNITGQKADSFKKEVANIFSLGLTKPEQVRRATNEALARTDIASPEWTFAAARVLLEDLYTQAAENRGYPSDQLYGSFYELVTRLTEEGLYDKCLLETYSLEDFKYIQSLIDPARDQIFTYIGLRLLSDRYIVRDFNEAVMELPQERFMVIAMYLMHREKADKRLQYVAEAYWALSNHYMTVATPTFFNSGKPNAQLSSCFIDVMDDNLDDIYLDNWDSARVSKHAGGVGVYVGKVRGLNSSIGGRKGRASGIVPWIKQLNGTAVAVDQEGKRQGAIAVYTDIWHWDLFEFLDLRTNNGDERLKARDVHPGLCVPDLFMELAKTGDDGRMLSADASWYLFDPHEVRTLMGFNLEDFYDETEGKGSWRDKYQECVDHPILRRKEVTVKKVVQAILTSQLETGHPYMFYRDEVNRKNANKHKGMIYCSNLCSEIAQNQSASNFVTETVINEGTPDEKIVITREVGDYVVCNLNSINLGRAKKDEVLPRLIPIMIRMLDNVIDINTLPLAQAQVTNRRYRPIGLGTFGWHHILALNGIDWNSEDSVKFADSLYEEVAFHAIKASVELGEEKGSYPYFEGSDWNTGKFFEDRDLKTAGSVFDWDALKERAKKAKRNGWDIAVAPNAATGLIAGSTQGIDPFYHSEGIYIEEKKDFKIPVVAPDMSPETFYGYYKRGAYSVSQLITIRQNAARQRYVDQAISFNLYVPKDIKGKDLWNLHFNVWKNKIKTTYYVHSKPNTLEDDCEACQ
ncbi:Ribonucleoside-diphosphate reductase subunit alpha 2 [compost metagenome]